MKIQSLLRNLGAVFAAAGFFFTACAANVVIQVDKSNGAVVTRLKNVEMGDVPDIGGKPNDRFSYGQAYESPDGLSVVYRGLVAAGGKIALHETGSRYVLYVVRGKGVLYNTDPAGKETSRLDYAPGDVIVFEPKTWHGWTNGPAEFEFIGFDSPNVK